MKRRWALLFILGYLLSPFLSFSQDSIPQNENLIEDKNLKFQSHFFKALAQKAIFNYSIAIQNLEECNQLKPNNVSVLFELSKNYHFLNKHIEAIAYGKQALQLSPKNRWLLEHVVSVYTKARNFTEAITYSKKLILLAPKKKEDLVFLYLQNNQINEAKKLVLEIEKSNHLSPILLGFKNQFIKNEVQKKEPSTASLQQLIRSFETEKNFVTLRKILTLSSGKNNDILLSFSTKGLELFPSQAIVYLMNGKAYNNIKKYNKAIVVLESGIDFVIDDNVLAANFYDELAKSYFGLGNKKEATKNKSKAKKLRKN